jgi:hypothetical protein
MIPIVKSLILLLIIIGNSGLKYPNIGANIQIYVNFDKMIFRLSLSR